MLETYDRPERKPLGLHTMTLPRNPETGWPIPDPDAIMPRPGATPYQMAPDYARFIAQSNGFQVGILDAVYRSILRQTWDAMARGESISWPNLFTFSAYTRKERIGRNPRTGDTITIPARLAVRVRAAQSFIKQIN